MHAESLAVRRQCLDDGPIVNGEFGFGDEAVPNALRQKRFDIAGGRCQRDGLALAASHSPTVVRSAASARSTATTTIGVR